jgi:hypothetical protein
VFLDDLKFEIWNLKFQTEDKSRCALWQKE